ncbi:MAG: hypothetical protein WA733_05605 [Methylocystis sp.]
MEGDFTLELRIVQKKQTSKNRIVEQRPPLELRVDQFRRGRDVRAAKIGEAFECDVGKIGVSVHLRLKFRGVEPAPLETRLVHESRVREGAFGEEFRLRGIDESAKFSVVESSASQRAHAIETGAGRKFRADETGVAGEDEAAKVRVFTKLMVAKIRSAVADPPLRMRIGESVVALMAFPLPKVCVDEPAQFRRHRLRPGVPGVSAARGFARGLRPNGSIIPPPTSRAPDPPSFA